MEYDQQVQVVQQARSADESLREHLKVEHDAAVKALEHHQREVVRYESVVRAAAAGLEQLDADVPEAFPHPGSRY